MSLFACVPWKLMMKVGPAAARFMQAAWQVAGASDAETSLPSLMARLEIVETETQRLQNDVKTMIIFLALTAVLSLCALVVGIVALIK